MTRFAAVLLLLLLAFSSAQAVTLSRIPVSQIADKIKTVVSSNDFMLPTTMALASNSNYQAAANLLTVPLYAYNPALGVAASAVIGFAFSPPLGLKQAYDRGALQSQPNLSQVISNLYSNAPSSGQVLPTDLGNIKIQANSTWSYFSGSPLPGTQYFHLTPQYGFYPSIIVGNNRYYVNPSRTLLYWLSTEPDRDQDYYKIYKIPCSPTTESPSSQGAPQTLPESDIERLVNAIVNAIATNPGIKTELNTIVKNNPDLVSNAPPITKEQMEEFLTRYKEDAGQNLIDQLTALKEANPNDPNITAELEKAIAEKQKEEAEKMAQEKFNPLVSNGFTQPYNPGEFDIPTRFTTFVNRVKASPLFSFSNGFFNSLPGGGSPIYEIDAGQYGHHTIDLSQTMSTGLAVLKTILLACFGFLSIRAVIMKR